MAGGRAQTRNVDWRTTFRQSLSRISLLAAAVLLFAFTLFLLLALLTYDSNDAALHTAAAGVQGNWMGSAGAWLADFLLFVGGIGTVLLVPLVAIFAVRLWRGDEQPRWKRQIVQLLGGALLIGLAAELWSPASNAVLPAGWGGIAALLAGREIAPLFELAGEPAAALLRVGVILILALVGLWLGWRALGLPKGLLSGPRTSDDIGVDDDRNVAAPAAKPASLVSKVIRPRPRAANEPRTPVEITDPSPRSAPAPRPRTAKQSELFTQYQLPALDLLSPPPPRQSGAIDKAALERNARLLESVLEDFQVKGVVTAVRPGPVVTMYELEPAPGTKASRVSNLADDIARNMSALSARIAPIPGRTVIGIELPNAKREAVVLHEMIGSSLFQEQTGQLPIILGKNISGDPVIADLAPMPHLLIAGTTGSGKSVGLNAMILSLLYRLGPDQCRLIMIDPKMLELSVYDGIPHLLSPVVTEPKKAIRALKWAVEQMEDRYRMMSSLSVRNLASYNEKVRGALAKGKSLGRRVQTGYDPESGQPVYEEETLDYQPLPQIVVVVDELADLMMTAGKEVEFLIQRLAQKARAAGIHLILATQRPSVDVITGVIKANLPTRISFNVTSKIDSRTILGEAGAEQLLGKGDMLYVPGGKQITRIHGPFVSDDEVRSVADHWRTQGQPDYVDSVTEEPEDGGFALDGAPVGEDSVEDRLYSKGKQIVIESQKASTSWLQRQLRIGYNTAARLIDRLEEEGIIGPPNHVGRREVLVDRNGYPR
jgi:DNA segregation ATPase FtsK/SpoIIIE, S-DNA-T family